MLQPFSSYSIKLSSIPQESKMSFEGEARAKEMKKPHEQVRAQIMKSK